MTKNTLTRIGLSDAVCRECYFTQVESARLVESVLGHISDALERGESVKILSFGTFTVRSKQARTGRNPKTGEDALISPRRVLKFTPSALLKKTVAAGNKA